MSGRGRSNFWRSFLPSINLVMLCLVILVILHMTGIFHAYTSCQDADGTFTGPCVMTNKPNRGCFGSWRCLMFVIPTLFAILYFCIIRFAQVRVNARWKQIMYGIPFFICVVLMTIPAFFSETTSTSARSNSSTNSNYPPWMYLIGAILLFFALLGCLNGDPGSCFVFLVLSN